MLECHLKQFQAILDSKSHNLMVKTGVHGGVVTNITRELEVQLVNWCSRFHDWINTQKSFVELLNGWLMKWLPQELEETPDGVVPFSPSRIAAPTVFIVSNDWNNALRMVSEAEVMTAMHNFAVNVHRLLEKQEEEQRQKLKAEYLSRDYAGRVRTLQNDSGMHGNLDIVPVTDSERVHQNDAMNTLELMGRRVDEERTKHLEIVKQIQEAASTSLKTGLLPVFEALRDYTSETVKAYEMVRIPKENDGKQ